MNNIHAQTDVCMYMFAMQSIDRTPSRFRSCHVIAPTTVSALRCERQVCINFNRREGK